MKLNLRRFTPRYSLRLLLICIPAIAALIAWYRDPLRARVEAILARARGPAPAVVIVGPQTAGVSVALDPPTPEQITQAVQAAGVLKEQVVNMRMVIEPISEYVDPPNFSVVNGRYQWHHAHYKCMIITDNGAKTIYIDHRQRCVP